MSDPSPIGAAAPTPPPVRMAIARAADATGVDFSYLLGQARLESSLDPNARAASSSAAGLYQFTQGTWLGTLDRHGAEHGFGWAGDAIEGGRVKDPAMRQKIMALRYDPQASALMAAELASDNRDALRGVLGREPDPAELYLAHFLGADGAGRFLTAMAADPGQSAAALFPKAAAANQGIFFAAGGLPRSLGEVMGLLRGKLDRAMASDSLEPLLASPVERARGSEPQPGVHAGAATPSRSANARPSMADTLAATFGGATGAMPGHVRAAYGTLKVFGL